MTWVASKLSGAAGALGAEAIELRNWLLRFGCGSKEFRVIIDRLADCITTPPPPLLGRLLRNNGLLPSDA